MGKKKIALLDLAESDSPKLKASGVRSQKLTQVKKDDKPVTQPVAVKVKGSVTSSDLQPKAKDGSEPKKVKSKKRVKHDRSKRYLTAKNLVDKTKTYPVAKAVKLLKKVSTTKFDASVELHLNLAENKLSGELDLPHGTGKKQQVEIASDKTLVKLKTGKIDFDILIAEPKMMGKLAKFAKLLGPKGLMPNPKTGTISDKPQEVKKKLAGGLTRYKSETKAPIMHLVIGKLSFSDQELEENIEKTINTILPKNNTSAYLCSSMSPSLKLAV